MTATSSPSKLCTIIRAPDGEWVECEIIEMITDYRTLLPRLAVKSRKLNAAGFAIIPTTGILYMQVPTEPTAAPECVEVELSEAVTP